jgi:HSP20 family molecular chaperone IbpA
MKTVNNEWNKDFGSDFENFFYQKRSFVIKKGGNDSFVDNSDIMIKIKCDMPGVRKEQIEVSFKEKGRVVISAKKINEDDREFEYHYMFSDNVNVDGTELTYENGVLIVEIPKVKTNKENKVFKL